MCSVHCVYFSRSVSLSLLSLSLSFISLYIHLACVSLSLLSLSLSLSFLLFLHHFYIHFSFLSLSLSLALALSLSLFISTFVLYINLFFVLLLSKPQVSFHCHVPTHPYPHLLQQNLVPMHSMVSCFCCWFLLW